MLNIREILARCHTIVKRINMQPFVGTKGDLLPCFIVAQTANLVPLLFFITMLYKGWVV